MEPQVKERLVGAVVLVCAAVIVLPMVLSGNRDAPSRETPAARPEPPPAPEPSFSSRIVPLAPVDPPAPRGDAPEPAPETAAAPPPPAKPQRPAPSPPPPATPQRPAPSPPPATRPAAPPPAPAAPEARADGDWVVQLGSFSNARNARALRDRLRSGGYPAFTRSTTHDGAKVTRVYVGPQASRERAEEMVSRLLRETRLKGMVLRNPER